MIRTSAGDYRLKPLGFSQSLNSTEAFEGTTSVAKTVSATPNQEVWVEVDHYKNTKARVIQPWGQSCKIQVRALSSGSWQEPFSPGFSAIMGELNPVKM